MFCGIASFCFITISSTLASREVFSALSIKIFKINNIIKQIIFEYTV